MYSLVHYICIISLLLILFYKFGDDEHNNFLKKHQVWDPQGMAYIYYCCYYYELLDD